MNASPTSPPTSRGPITARWTTSPERRRTPRVTETRDLMRDVDRNGDGFVVHEEFTGPEKAFASLDVDGRVGFPPMRGSWRQMQGIAV